ncbi:ABC transporter ATP-binding protein [Pseudochelatococcus contaminans]|uniref:Spermidine/putrescine import ATP-binding protein PotA n=1 Tax=Pseudochelatococcus contaminans TaxID=1538103 RepID=A0A7W6EFE1_9HYPH|nr:ABC transporter ATP-binding protein [Pseudochelatococcus contaminans]MBB3808282.1 putrescine transport system ATP-binding protein [Pseudochelatococcus contaminans]
MTNVRTDARKRDSLAIGAVRRDFAPWLDPAAKPLIRYEAVTKQYSDFVAVNNLTLNIYEREFFCLLGPSGCGKTTLMRMLAGFEEPTAGRILLGDQVVSGIPPYRRPVNMMFQSYALFPHMNVEKNIAFGLVQDGVPKNEIADRVAETLRLVQLTPFARRKPDQLSGGQRQRVALARALIKRPKVLLLDEPLGALDKKLRSETQFELMDLQVNLGMTFLVVTHDQEEAMVMADRVAVMDKGTIKQIAPPGQVYEQPASRYVAEFIGDVNIIEGKIAEVGEHQVRVTRSDGAGTLLIDLQNEPVSVGQEVAVALRPEKLVLHRDLPTDTPNVLSGDIWDIGYLGDWTIYLVQLASGQIVRVSRANSRRFVEQPLTWDDKVHITFASEAGVLLTH